MAQVRMAVTADEREILGLLAQLLGTQAPRYAPEWACSGDALATVRYRIEKRQLMVAEQDGTLVGAASWRGRVAAFPQRHVRYVELETLFVLPAYRRQGIARQLCERVQRDCRERAIAQIRIERALGSQEQAMLASAGFVEFEKSLVWPGTSVATTRPAAGAG